MHALTGRTIPIYAANYVISGYGTKAVMGVPGHDDRDLLFAQDHDLPIITLNHLREVKELYAILIRYPNYYAIVLQ